MQLSVLQHFCFPINSMHNHVRFAVTYLQPHALVFVHSVLAELCSYAIMCSSASPQLSCVLNIVRLLTTHEPISITAITMHLMNIMNRNALNRPIETTASCESTVNGYFLRPSLDMLPCVLQQFRTKGTALSCRY
jgi:hypothetical protein